MGVIMKIQEDFALLEITEVIQMCGIVKLILSLVEERKWSDTVLWTEMLREKIQTSLLS